MLTYTITTSLNSFWWITQSNHTWTVGANGLIHTGSSYQEDYSAIIESSAQSNNRIVVNGTVISEGNSTHDDSGIWSAGTSTDVIVRAGGSVSGEFGICLHGLDQSLKNQGKITGIDNGVDVLHEALIENAGTIRASIFGLASADDAIQILNQANGTIAGTIDGISIHAVSGQESKIVNYGMIKGGVYALVSSAGTETVLNHGRMVGDVVLGNGADVFDNRGGTVKGDILGDLGNDTLITDSAATRLTEGVGAGYDTVRSSVSYALNANVENLYLLGSRDADARGNEMANQFEGNAGDNRIFGKGGADRLDGHRGNDILSGGASADIFMFSKGSGTDRITDFEAGVDDINLSGLPGITSFADLKAHHVRQDGADLIIHAGHDRLIIDDFTRAELQAGDFPFAL